MPNWFGFYALFASCNLVLGQDLDTNRHTNADSAIIYLNEIYGNLSNGDTNNAFEIATMHGAFLKANLDSSNLLLLSTTLMGIAAQILSAHSADSIEGHKIYDKSAIDISDKWMWVSTEKCKIVEISSVRLKTFT
jgi:hypothetical protein